MGQVMDETMKHGVFKNGVGTRASYGCEQSNCGNRDPSADSSSDGCDKSTDGDGSSENYDVD